ncbi:hypothetical protein QWT87_14675 [Chryseobacterium sp. APV1]|uniref:SMODS and SLOG-associating 2TM effector domain-containing protein n=1 Tax=Chryseobacterium urinae TaxID=3058400 RepID=A0ABT8U929_9FLAO|nr:hypothetical protein [Chryseobacterium sp. APV1]MDO3426143.1 hypothetical protein [Chryseobacterium sp. APV1]
MLDFYKNKFERELKRRVELDNAVNSPILVCSLSVGLNSYIIKEHNFAEVWDLKDYVIIFILITSSVLILFSCFYIFQSVNNFLRGFDYPNFDLMSRYLDIEIFNKQCVDESEKIDIDEIIKNKIVKYSDEATIINDKRSENLFKARKFIILNFITTTINIIIITSINLAR